jgi:hypothetical protein
MKNDYFINKIKNKKDNCLFHIYMLKLNKDYRNPNLGLMTKARACKVASQEEARE